MQRLQQEATNKNDVVQTQNDDVVRLDSNGNPVEVIEERSNSSSLTEESSLLRCETGIAGDHLQFVILAEKDAHEVGQFLLHHFFPHVPTGLLVGIDCSVEVAPWVDDFAAAVLRSPTCIGIRNLNDADRKLVALIINVVERQGVDNGPDMAYFIDPIQHPKMTMTLAFLEQFCDLPVDLAADQVFNIFMVAVDPDFGRRELASKLIHLSIQLAKRMAIETVVTQAVSCYAMRAFEKCGFRAVKQVEYNRFVYQGQTPMANNGVHQIAALMIHR